MKTIARQYAAFEKQERDLANIDLQEIHETSRKDKAIRRGSLAKLVKAFTTRIGPIPGNPHLRFDSNRAPELVWTFRRICEGASDEVTISAGLVIADSSETRISFKRIDTIFYGAMGREHWTFRHQLRVFLSSRDVEETKETRKRNNDLVASIYKDLQKFSSQNPEGYSQINNAN